MEIRCFPSDNIDWIGFIQHPKIDLNAYESVFHIPSVRYYSAMDNGPKLIEYGIPTSLGLLPYTKEDAFLALIAL